MVLGHAQDNRELMSEKYILDIVPFRITLDRTEGIATEPVHVTAPESEHGWRL